MDRAPTNAAGMANTGAHANPPATPLSLEEPLLTEQDFGPLALSSVTSDAASEISSVAAECVICMDRPSTVAFLHGDRYTPPPFSAFCAAGPGIVIDVANTSTLNDCSAVCWWEEEGRGQASVACVG